MKTMLYIVTLIAIFIGATQLAMWCESGWKTVPTESGKWRACYTKSYWDGMATGCSSPLSFDEAEWLTRTKGGKETR